MTRRVSSAIPQTLAGLGVIAVGLTCAPNALAGTPMERMIARVTAVRSNAGCAPLHWDPVADQVASKVNSPDATGTTYFNDPAKGFAELGVTVDAAFARAAVDDREDPTTDQLIDHASAVIRDCTYTTVGISFWRDDNQDMDYETIVLSTDFKQAAAQPNVVAKLPNIETNLPQGQLVPVDKPADPPVDQSVTYTLKATGLPVSSINISYLGDNDQLITDNNIAVIAGWTWTKTVKPKGAPVLKVSANSPGLVGLTLECSANSNIAANTKTGTVHFSGGLTPVGDQSCG